MKTITVYIGDQHEVVRYGLKALFREQNLPDIQVVGETDNGFKILEDAEINNADVYLLNLQMPGINIIDVLPRIKKASPKAEIVVVSSHYDKILVEHSFVQGATGFILDKTIGDEIIEAMRSAAKGEYFLCSEIPYYILQPIITKICNGDGTYEKPKVTNRQREILKCICDGLTEKEIGKKLCISFHTVHVHTTNIMKALDLHTKADLIKYGIRKRLVPIDLYDTGVLPQIDRGMILQNAHT